MKKNLFVSFICLAVAMTAVSGCKKGSGGTVENLKAAITGETTASAKYAAYAAKAKEEKLDKIAKLFEAASKAEAIHAEKHIAVLESMGEKMDAITPSFTVKSTKENIEDAIKGESHEVDSMYPEFIKTATEAKNDDAVVAFNHAFQVEKVHLELYKVALDALNKNNFNCLADSYSVCPICGYTLGGKVLAECSICGAPAADFIKL